MSEKTTIDKFHTRNVGEKTQNKDKRQTKEITLKYKTKIMSKTYSTKKTRVNPGAHEV